MTTSSRGRLSIECLFVIHGCTRPIRKPIHWRTRFLSNRCRWRQGTEETLSNSIAHYAAARVVDAREALVSVFEFRRCWIRAKHRAVKLCRYCSRSRENNIDHECGAGTFCFERGPESSENRRFENWICSTHSRRDQRALRSTDGAPLTSLRPPRFPSHTLVTAH